ncbi:DUF3106 domain-containing protein [Roseateles amylovorans]|uniref:DUF3106 domain-containing protein n=1 Tax=Roseateles amylovorans TaxID=2978473 RepID=A0ABY6AV89_9BURK|nr:DUF3106 domain-containing protein [Roseateles amylovorans]UXH77116.1 DUF3106 domain-containing protein [Roseateles amylovorans]
MSASLSMAWRPTLRSLLRQTALFGAGVALAASVSAQAGASSAPAPVAPTGAAALALSPNWASLTPAQKDALAPLSREWDQLDSALKGKWLEIAARYPKLSDEHQQRLRERMVEWTRMSPTERQKARIGYQRASELRGEDQQSRLQAKWEAYRALPPEKRQELADRAERAAEKASERASEKMSAEAPAARAKHRPPLAPIQRAPLTVNSTGPTVVQARPGATTVLLTQRAEPALTSASAAGGAVLRLRSPREAGLDPHTLLPLPKGASR